MLSQPLTFVSQRARRHDDLPVRLRVRVGHQGHLHRRLQPADPLHPGRVARPRVRRHAGAMRLTFYNCLLGISSLVSAHGVWCLSVNVGLTRIDGGCSRNLSCSVEQLDSSAEAAESRSDPWAVNGAHPVLLNYESQENLSIESHQSSYKYSPLPLLLRCPRGRPTTCGRRRTAWGPASSPSSTPSSSSSPRATPLAACQPSGAQCLCFLSLARNPWHVMSCTTVSLSAVRCLT